MHYGTPTWLENEFAHPDYPQHVAEYGARFAERYGDFATDYTPVNEPVIHALFSGEYAYWPPYLSGARGFTTIAVNLARGFVRTQQAIAELVPNAAFVHVDAAMKFVGDVDAPEHRDEAARLHRAGVPGRGPGDRPGRRRASAGGGPAPRTAWTTTRSPGSATTPCIRT